VKRDEFRRDALSPSLDRAPAKPNRPIHRLAALIVAAPRMADIDNAAIECGNMHGAGKVGPYIPGKPVDHSFGDGMKTLNGKAEHRLVDLRRCSGATAGCACCIIP
jgi:hypothetical protein